jgi:hypothetical protein
MPDSTLHYVPTVETTGGVKKKKYSRSLTDFRVRVHLDSNQSINDATYTKVLLETVTSSDPESMFQAGSNDIIIKRDGAYDVHFQGGFATDATGDRAVRIKVNGTEVASDSEPSPAAVGGSSKTYTLEDLSIDDVITFEAYQSSGGALNVIGDRAKTFAVVAGRCD